MLGIKPLISTEKCIFNPPPAGEPNPTFFYDGKTPRERIVQEGKKGIQCWYTVMCWLQPQVGRFHAKKFEELKIRQALVKDRFDILRKIEESFELTHVLYSTLEKSYGCLGINKEGVEQLLKERLRKIEPEMREKVREVLQDFLERCEKVDVFERRETVDFIDFVEKELQDKSNRCEELFLFDAAYPTGQFSEEAMRKFIIKSYTGSVKRHLEKEWSELTNIEKMWALGEMSMLMCGYLLNFTSSTWNPRKRVTDLIAELKRGPLMVNGNFGRRIYKSDPVEIEKIAARSIWRWKKAEMHLHDLDQFHPILIVGAKSGADNDVYFVDPSDRSDPSAPPPIYAISYSTFIQAIAPLYGAKMPLDEIHEEAKDYAWSAKEFKGYL